MTKYATKNLFDFMKGLGMWKQYDTYEDYQKGEQGVGIEGEEEHKKEFNEWHNSLPEQEKKDFDTIFGEPVDNSDFVEGK